MLSIAEGNIDGKKFRRAETKSVPKEPESVSFDVALAPLL